MYETFYNLQGRPFLAAPVAARYFPAAPIEQARTAITRCVERGSGAAVIMGAAGTGKSMLCHVLATQMHDQFAIVTLASARLCTRRALLQNILYELKLPYREREEGDLRLALVDYLQGDAPDAGVLLIVDEADSLPLRLLEEIRMLTNLVHDGKPRVQVVLAAKLAFDERLASPRLESFNQRIAARCYLQQLSREETRGFVVAQLAAVGADAESIISSGALDAVYQATGGVARLVNQVCDHALVLGALNGRTTIDERGIEEAWADLQQLPMPSGEAMSEEASGHAILEFGELDDEPTMMAGAVDAAADGDGNLEAADMPTATVALAAGTLGDAAVDDEISADDPPMPQLRLSRADDDAEADADDQFRPADQTPEIELIFQGAYDPFDEPFDDEEVVVDPLAALEALNTPHVTLGDSDPVAAETDPEALAAAPAPSAPILPSPNEVVVAASEFPADQQDAGTAVDACATAGADNFLEVPKDDRDLLEILDDAGEATQSCQAAARSAGKLRPYRHLFADLRGRIAQ